MCTPFLFRIPGYKTDKSKTALLKAGEDWAYRLDIHSVADSPESLKDPRLKQSCLTLGWGHVVNYRNQKPLLQWTLRNSQPKDANFLLKAYSSLSEQREKSPIAMN